ncbi:MAG: family transcriptional regulator, anaerobic regulatory protein [Pseudomonadota bacterium]|nr:family transcriptional regulator, anaerobic regulatory protein [Pseudomonadota bacterium]MDQ5907448.1 family transcriptional regulator, anaerobic regulatory protein [Pseudomonadota bacterium]MDQ5960418.1 family transcriptional regulator, anaerobic regulatory protein [Pseudomonadota bacterium]
MNAATALSPAGLLQLYPALATLDHQDLELLCRPESLMSVPAGTQLFAEAQPCRGFPLLISGSIKVVKAAPSGREMLLYRVEPGGSCIITSSCLLGHTAYSARGEAETDLQMLALPPALFSRLVAEQAAFRDFVFHLFSDRIAELMQLIEEVAFHRLDQRLARLLLSRGDSIQATHQALADELGSVREIVSRLLKGFASEGLVSLGRENITLLDREGLKRLAQMM